MTYRTKPLDEWLEKHHARLLWTAKVTEAYGVLGRHVLECWRINASPFLVVRYNGGLEGWDIYTSHGGTEIKATLEDAESRLLPAQRLNVEPCFACGSTAEHPREGCKYYRTTPAGAVENMIEAAGGEEWHIVYTHEGKIEFVFHETRLADAQNAACACAHNTGLPRFVGLVRGTKPVVGTFITVGTCARSEQV